MDKVTSVLHVFNEVLPLANTTAKELELLLKFMLLALYGYLIHGLRLDFELSHGTQLCSSSCLAAASNFSYWIAYCTM